MRRLVGGDAVGLLNLQYGVCLSAIFSNTFYPVTLSNNHTYLRPILPEGQTLAFFALLLYVGLDWTTANALRREINYHPVQLFITSCAIWGVCALVNLTRADYPSIYAITAGYFAIVAIYQLINFVLVYDVTPNRRLISVLLWFAVFGMGLLLGWAAYLVNVRQILFTPDNLRLFYVFVILGGVFVKAVNLAVIRDMSGAS